MKEVARANVFSCVCVYGNNFGKYDENQCQSIFNLLAEVNVNVTYIENICNIWCNEYRPKSILCLGVLLDLFAIPCIHIEWFCVYFSQLVYFIFCIILVLNFDSNIHKLRPDILPLSRSRIPSLNI